jgi:hypothetical protein
VHELGFGNEKSKGCASATCALGIKESEILISSRQCKVYLPTEVLNAALGGSLGFASRRLLCVALVVVVIIVIVFIIVIVVVIIIVILVVVVVICLIVVVVLIVVVSARGSFVRRATGGGSARSGRRRPAFLARAHAIDTAAAATVAGICGRGCGAFAVRRRTRTHRDCVLICVQLKPCLGLPDVLLGQLKTFLNRSVSVDRKQASAHI